MSFSREVKEELAGHTGGARHCQLAELAAIMSFPDSMEGTERACIPSVSSWKMKMS